MHVGNIVYQYILYISIHCIYMGNIVYQYIYGKHCISVYIVYQYICALRMHGCTKQHADRRTCDRVKMWCACRNTVYIGIHVCYVCMLHICVLRVYVCCVVMCVACAQNNMQTLIKNTWRHIKTHALIVYVFTCWYIYVCIYVCMFCCMCMHAASAQNSMQSFITHEDTCINRLRHAYSSSKACILIM